MGLFKYRIDFMVGKEVHWPIEIQVNVDLRETIFEEYVRNMVKYLILSTVNVDCYKEGDKIFAHNITLSMDEEGKNFPFYSSDRTLQVYPRLNKE